MPPLQQLLRSYRTCQSLAQIHVQTPMLHQPWRNMQVSAAAVAGHSLGQLRSCKACAGSSASSLHSSQGRQTLQQQQQEQEQTKAFGGSSSSSRLASLGCRPKQFQQVCFASSQPSSSTPQPSSTNSIWTLPTMLTLGRVAAIPALIAAWFWQDPAASTVVTALFIVASLTDWLDGYLARKMNLSTPFGAFLDPVADKLMVAAVLILLSTQPLAAGPLAGNTWLVPVATLVIIGREISMSALREWAATMGPAAKAAVAVNNWGKWKTASQMVALTCLLLTKDGAQGQLGAVAAAAGAPLLGVAAYLTAYSLALYVAGLWKFMK